jgi:hypothetical protein
MKKYTCEKCKDEFECLDLENFSLCPECDEEENNIIDEEENNIIYAVDDDDFQEYTKNGVRVKDGERIGIEKINEETNELELILDEGVKYG